MRQLLKKMKNNFIENAYFIRKRLVCVIFICFIIIFSAYNMYINADEIKEAFFECVNDVRKDPEELQEHISSFEQELEENFAYKMQFIECFGFVQKTLNKKEISNFTYIKDNTGSLHYASFYRDDDNNCFEYAMRVKRLKDYVSKYDTEVVFVVAPSKYVASDSRFSKDMPVNDPQVLVDETLFYMNRLGVDTIDLNLYFPNEEIPYEEAFFKTDHHWTAPAAFYATEILTDFLNEKYEYNLDCDKYLTKENYRKEVYKQGMLGSMGRATGFQYSGLEDMTVLYPKFQMEIERTFIERKEKSITTKGDIIGTIILPEKLIQEDIYSDSQYSVYLNSIYAYEQIKNLSNPNGKKILMIRDSYFSPVITFMTPMCGQIDAIWNLTENHEIDIEQYIRANQFDCIIIEVYPYNIGDSAFQFFMDDLVGGEE